ncbi:MULTISPECIES: hypothetical protein [unclassified Guyparkeria]|uniref:hypothetical protein n=1 Tax=unclassified Guyparkeria TaxID=2626246 RepID=UPI00073BC1E7|nr:MULTISPECIES: hypothetical protein [unclassified Guyparkeria]KTG17939.1 hypothetical protein AUR63_07435 [Guyparkeria sp. XI15]OAE89648.1 hypothetical protein AWR35_07450 [Guyparkeria sp. WRN-7]
MTQRSLVGLAALLLLGFAGLLAYLVFTLPPEQAQRLFSEAGWFEDATPMLWLFLAVVLLFARPIALSHRVGMAVIAAALAAREEGWHKKFTADSMFKTDYYQMDAVPMTEQLVAGSVAVGLTLLLLWILFVGFRQLFLRGGWHRPWGWVALFALALAPLLKLVDRGPSLLDDHFGLLVPPAFDLVLKSIEEGFEFALPLIFLLALGLFATDPHGRPADVRPTD